MTDKANLRVVFTGAKKDLEILASMFTDMEHLGKMGSNRRLVLSVDGDGGGQILSHFPDFEKPPLPTDECRRSIDTGSDIRYYIGEYR